MRDADRRRRRYEFLDLDAGFLIAPKSNRQLLRSHAHDGTINGTKVGTGGTNDLSSPVQLTAQRAKRSTTTSAKASANLGPRPRQATVTAPKRRLHSRGDDRAVGFEQQRVATTF